MSDAPVALVSGAAQGIGKAIAARLLAAGYRVALSDINAALLTKTAHELGDPATVLATGLDSADEAAVAGWVADAQAWGGRIDALINNAAIANAQSGPLATLALADWQRVLDVNLTGPLLAAKHAAPHLTTAHGAMVMISSTRALQSEPESEAYAASKGGLLALTHALAASLGPAVRVNAICPGWIDTRGWRPDGAAAPPLSAADHSQHLVGRVGIPEDIAGLVAFLIGPEAGFITGQAFVVDGGMTKKMIYVE